ncbi:DUF916 domain-containing protein [Lapidilactobacillus luobeiensis]|uniref:DUF916 domain-containing protein n=1 Tax=Lapidilactobacillus luobeiensis TaxID=2950371 RepID=UPI0021C326F9|nr:DUF916 domain-containing protein [Lapidilactobacillus luobeiensis]
MKKNRSFILPLAFAVLLMVLMIPTKVQAAGLPFSVSPQLPSEQREKTSSYFDVIVGTGQQTRLVVQLKNETDQTVKVKASVATAQTNDSGQVAYGIKQKTDTTLKYQLPDLVKGPATVTLPANETVAYTATLTMPTQHFAGLVAGAFIFSPVTAQTTEAQKGLAIKNEFRYAITVIARDVDQVWLPQLKLGAAQIRQDESQNTIAVPLNNVSATFLNQLHVETKAVNTTTGKKYQRTVSKMQMAPNSHFYYRLKLPTDPDAGKYRVETKAYYVRDSQGHYQATDGQRYRYQETSSNTVTLTQARKRQLQSKIKQAQGGTPWFVYAIGIGFGVLILIILILVIILLRLRRKKRGGRSDEVSKK